MNTVFFSTFLIAGAMFSLSVCAQSDGQSHLSSKPLTQATLGNQSLHLLERNGQCVLVKPDGGQLKMGMEWPCRFSEDQQKKVRIENLRRALIVMIERSEHLPAPNEGCATDLQSIRLYKGMLEVSPVSRVTACGPRYWDQKVLTWQFDW